MNLSGVDHVVPGQNFELNREVRVGSHLFVNPEDSVAMLCHRLGVLEAAGFRLIRLFLPWCHLEPRPGIWRWTPYREIFDEAERRGLGVVATLMPVSPPGWMGMTQGLQDVADLDDIQFWDRSRKHLRRVVKEFREHPALDSWILWNEPNRALHRENPPTWRAFQKFLENRYDGSIEAYRAVHYTAPNSFAEIVTPSNVSGAAYETGFVSHRWQVEWLDFTLANMEEKLGVLAREVRLLDGRHPIHLNPHRVSQCLAPVGQSIWRQAEVVDFLGCSAHPAWHSVRFPSERIGDSLAMFADLMRSATRADNDYFWVTELQGGTTLMSGFTPLAATPEEARLWLWQCLGAGAKAVIYWCANARIDGYEAGEWDLLDTMGNPTARLVEISQTLRRLEPHLSTLAQARSPIVDVGILVSDQSQILDLVEGEGDRPENPRNRQKGADAAAGAYLMAADLSLEVKFFNPDRFCETSPEDLPRVVVVPNLTVIDGLTIAALEAAVRSGCTVIGDGLFAWKDRFGRLATDLAPAVANLWGVPGLGFEAIPPVRHASGEGTVLHGWFCRMLGGEGEAEVLGTWDDGLPAWWRRPAGEGKSVRIGTQFFQRYLTAADPRAREWFLKTIDPSLRRTTRLDNPSPTLRLRRLAIPGGTELGLLINSDVRGQMARLHREGLADENQEINVPGQDAVLVPLIPTLRGKRMRREVHALDQLS